MQFRDLGAQYQVLKNEIDEEIRKVLESSRFILGEPVRELEEKLAEYAGRKHCIGVANGLDALTLILKAMGVQEGDEVIVPSNTYIATALAVSQTGALPVPVFRYAIKSSRAIVRPDSVLKLRSAKCYTSLISSVITKSSVPELLRLLSTGSSALLTR